MLAVGLMFGSALLGWSADPFPGDLPGTEIGGTLPASYEPSGIVWHTRLARLFLVSDGGTVTASTADGDILSNWSVPGDLEGVCVADPSGDVIFLGVENPDSVREFDVSTGQVLRTFDLTATMQGPDNSGLEALTFVPDPAHPEGGVFYAGLQSDGRIYVFNLPIRSSASSTVVTLVNTITPVSGRTAISGLHYDRETGVLYAIFDGPNRVVAMDPDGTMIADWELPGNDQEGVTLKDCELFVAEDVGPEVWRYGFPATSEDDDGDGVPTCDDLCPATPQGTLVDPDGCTVAAGCTDDADCDDGSFCNGNEACDPLSGCQPGAAPDCTGQLCSDAAAQCVDCLSGLDCGPGQVCIVSSGQCDEAPPAGSLPIGPHDPWRYLEGITGPPADWSVPAFDDSSWSIGSGGFGYGTDCGASHGTVLPDMQGSYVSVFVRRSFHVDDPTTISSLALTLDYDDSFVAYLNGIEVARDNVQGDPPEHTRTADADHECSGSTTVPNEPMTITLDPSLLSTGNNVVAIQGHNLSLDSSDFSLVVGLTSVGPAECYADRDCDDGDPCTVDSCQNTACLFESPDADGDGVADCLDNCPVLANPEQRDYDYDGTGDSCETGTALADADRSGRVDGVDLAQLARSFGSTCGAAVYDPATDFDRDCTIDGTDLSMMAPHFGQRITEP